MQTQPPSKPLSMRHRRRCCFNKNSLETLSDKSGRLLYDGKSLLVLSLTHGKTILMRGFASINLVHATRCLVLRWKRLFQVHELNDDRICHVVWLMVFCHSPSLVFDFAIYFNFFAPNAVRQASAVANQEKSIFDVDN